MNITTSEYDLYLGDMSLIQGYRVRSLSRDSAPQIAPRFSTGAEGQTELDMLKSTSVDDFVGGMFQRDWIDNTRVARMVGIYNPYNAMLYPSFAPTPHISTPLNTGTPAAKAEDETQSFIAMGGYYTGTGYYSKLYKVDRNATGGVLTQITLPTAFTSSAGYQITGLEIHGGYLYIAASAYGSSVTCHRMKINTEAFVNITGAGTLFAELRGVLYLINGISAIYTVTNEFAAGAATYTKIDTIGRTDYSNNPTDMVEFNGALWIAKPDGLFRFDGVKGVKVLKYPVRSLCEFNGALYYISKQWLYKFDGTNITKLQFFGYGESFDYLSFASNQDYLFFETYVAGGTFQSEPDKFGSGNARRRLYSYDGQAFSIIKETEMTGLYKRPFVGLLYANNMILELFFLAQSVSDTAPWDIYYNMYDLNNMFLASAITSSAVLEATTSEFDAGYPNVYKSVNVIDVSFTGIIAGDSLAITYQLFDGKTWGSWITLGSITSTTDNKIEIVNPTKMLFKRIKFNVTATFATGSTLAVKGVSLRWTLQPRVRWRWQTLLCAYGVNTDNRLNNAPVAPRTANYLNNLVTQSVKQKTPIYLLSPDYGVVKTGVNAAAVSIQIDGEVPVYSDPYQEYPLVSIKNDSGVWEILRVTAAIYDGVKTTLTIESRGYLGITAAAIAAGNEFHLCYRVFITRLVRDAPALDDNSYDEQTTKNSQIQREFMIEMVEV
jgi:hypothetical protein